MKCDTMLQALLMLLPTLSTALAWTPVQELESGNVTTSLGSSGQCVCRAFLPDTSFPANRVQNMQQVTEDLMLEMKIQINKMESYQGKLGIYLKELTNLNQRVTTLESSFEKYVKLDFELLRTEIREFEVLVFQLKNSLNSSSPLFDNLYTEIQNITMIVNQLETYDKSNLEMIRVEFGKLQKKLEECQRDHNYVEPNIGNCNHTGIFSLSDPMVIQINAHLSAGYTYGGWGKDSKPIQGNENMYFYGGYSSPQVYDFYFYSDYGNLILRNLFKRHRLASGWIGFGNNYIVHSNNIYYQRYSPLSMAKLNLTTSKYDYMVISDASTAFSYAYSANQYLDLAADENGVWVMYATANSRGKIVLAKINEKSFGIEKKWNTGVFKNVIGNAFMACGVMYATTAVDVNTEEIFYAYDTIIGEEKDLSIEFKKFQEKYSNLDYNPADQKLYMYNNGYYVSYNVRFK